MYIQVRKFILLLPITLLLLLLPGALHSAQLCSPYMQRVAVDPEINVVQTSSTSLSVNWVWSFGTAPSSYTVTVTDLTTHTVLSSSSVSNRFITVTGLTLTSGHVIRTSVEANGYVIIVDTTMV